MSEFYSTLITMKEYEKELEYNSDPAIRHYIQSVNTVMKEMQAYIDYLLLEEWWLLIHILKKNLK